jgi:hypothetical protein
MEMINQHLPDERQFLRVASPGIGTSTIRKIVSATSNTHPCDRERNRLISEQAFPKQATPTSQTQVVWEFRAHRHSLLYANRGAELSIR